MRTWCVLCVYSVCTRHVPGLYLVCTGYLQILDCFMKLLVSLFLTGKLRVTSTRYVPGKY